MSMLSTRKQEGSQYDSAPTRMREERCIIREDVCVLFFGPGLVRFGVHYVNSRTQFWRVLAEPLDEVIIEVTRLASGILSPRLNGQIKPEIWIEQSRHVQEHTPRLLSNMNGAPVPYPHP